VKLTIDTKNAVVTAECDGVARELPLASSEAFDLVSQAWLRASWDSKYVYGFTWFGRPIIQLPEDIVRMQELIYALKPTVVIETGIAHGGSLVFYASLFKAMGRGRVIGVDVDIRQHNRKAIQQHEFAPLITLIEGNSIDPTIASRVKAYLEPDDTVIVVLDSNHSKSHVLAELRLYAPLVSVGSYVVVCDGIMEYLVGGPRTKSDWDTNNPRQAVLEFISRNQSFVLDEPKWPFNEGAINHRVTYWPDAFIKRVK